MSALPEGTHAPARPIVVLGLCKRTGTNYVAQLLRRHADVGTPAPIWEHFLLEEADRLLGYARATRARWSERWGDLDDAEADLVRHLGRGLQQFLVDRAGAPRVVAKCPSVAGLHHAPALLDGCDLVLLARDGRAVTESLHAGFGWSYERAAREWTRGAEAAVRFEDTRSAEGGDLRHALFRYEDLLDAEGPGLRALLDFCGLDAARYDLADAASMPVYGSSFERGATGEVSWKSIERPAGFDPTGRFANWDAATHRLFDRIGGTLNARLGYERGPAGRSEPDVRARVLDATWPVRRTAATLLERVRR